MNMAMTSEAAAQAQTDAEARCVRMPYEVRLEWEALTRDFEALVEKYRDVLTTVGLVWRDADGAEEVELELPLLREWADAGVYYPQR